MIALNYETRVRRLNIILMILILMDLLISFVHYDRAGSPWGWVANTFNENKPFTLHHGLSVLQVIFFAATLDQIAHRSCILYNINSKNSQIPKIVIELIRVLIYGLSFLTGFILLYDYSLNVLIATSSAVGLGVVYALKDLLTDNLASLELQFYNRFSIGDWIELTDGDFVYIYKVLQMDHRMVTVLNHDEQHIQIHNTQFVSGRIVNLSRQKQGNRRKIQFQLDARYSYERVLPVLKLALKHVSTNNSDFDTYQNCLVGGTQDGDIQYIVKYQCSPAVVPPVNETR